MTLFGTEDLKRVFIIEFSIRLILIGLVLTVLTPVFYADVNTYFFRARGLGLDFLPYRDFLWEYPPLAALPLLLLLIVGDNRVAFFLLFTLVTVALEWSTLRMLRTAYKSHAWQITKFWTLSVVPLCAIAWFRLDLLPTFFAALGLMALIKGRSRWWAAVAGFATKLWPIVFVAPMLVLRQWRAAALSVAGSAAVLGAWYLYSPEGFRAFIEFREGEGFQVESIPGNLLMLFTHRPSEFVSGALVVSDSGWEWVQVLLSVLLLALPAAVFVAAWFRKDRVDLVAMCGALTLGLLLTTRLLSPQFLVWVAPFVAIVGLRRRWIAIAYGVAAWLTVIEIQFYVSVYTGRIAANLVVFGRNVLLVALLIGLIRATFSPKTVAADADESSTDQLAGTGTVTAR